VRVRGDSKQLEGKNHKASFLTLRHCISSRIILVHFFLISLFIVTQKYSTITAMLAYQLIQIRVVSCQSIIYQAIATGPKQMTRSLNGNKYYSSLG
jgi:hypothetical protein